MPVIVPIRDLKDTTKISEMCHSESRPIFVTKNGYGDMVIMSMEHYQDAIGRYEIYAKLTETKNEIAAGTGKNARRSLAGLGRKYGV